MVAAGAVLAAGAIAFVEAIGAAAFVAGAAAVEAAGVEAFSGLLQEARAQAKATAEMTMKYFFMLVTTKMCGEDVSA